MRKGPVLWLGDNRGIYIPRDFAASFDDRAKDVSGVDDDFWEVLETGPDHEYYWDVWNEVLENAVVTDKDGSKYRLHQDGDLWIIPEGMEWSEKIDWFEWPQ